MGLRHGSDRLILVIALLGIVFASYAVTLHFAPSSSSLCNISAALNCETVNKSPWAVFLGVPVAILGLLSYLAVFLVVLKRRAIQEWLAFTSVDFAQYLFFAVVLMFGFQMYLTAVEAFIIHSYCVVCLASQACTLLLLALVSRELVVAK